MSQLLINSYLKQLALIKKVSGSQRETIVREAFKDLLKSWGKQRNLVFIAEYPLKTIYKTDIAVDGALLHEIRMPLGYWEAKDAKDNLDVEIGKKLKKGYPQDNIVFTDDATAVLIQSKTEVMRCDMTDTAALAKLVGVFFAYERPEIADFRKAVKQFRVDLPDVLDALRHMIEEEQEANKAFRVAKKKFLTHAQEAINPSLTDADVREMLIQHILTEDIFSKIFGDSEFHRHNNVARELYNLEAIFFTGNVKWQLLKSLEPYYAAIRSAAAQITDHSEKQTFLKVIYESFYKVYNKKAADRLGVVYTPNEIVRFMIDAADTLCESHFAKNLIDKEVEILDPATGTGTFICELLEHFRGQPKKLQYKYVNELHANEVAILPYYVANLNIEATYSAILDRYEEFPSLCFVDTLDNVGLHTAAKGHTADIFGSVSEENMARIKRQNSKRISVVIGNPPYNANQLNENDNNKNRTYKDIDARIKATYIAASSAKKTKLYDMYVRFFRWASDRINENGVIAFVSNNSFLDGRTFDGFRKVIAKEFNQIVVVDLKGNARTSGERRRKEGGNIFHNQIRVGIAIWFCVKKAGATGCSIRYQEVADYAKADDKLSFVAEAPLAHRKFELIEPDARGNWLHLSDNDFQSLIPLVSDATKAAKTPGKEKAIFKLFGNGINTARDEWVTSFSQEDLEHRVKFFLKEYDKYSPDAEEFAGPVKWSRNLKTKLARGQREKFDAGYIRSYLYRPFVKTNLYLSPLMIDEKGQLAAFDHPSNVMLNFSARGEFRCLATNSACDWHFLGDTKVVGFRRFDSMGNSADNVTDWGLKQFRLHYGKTKPKSKDAQITKRAIFNYCYAVLHDPLYRATYGDDLARELPRIPLYADFWRWSDWGNRLVKLHVDYASVAPFEFRREDVTDIKAKASGIPPSALLKEIEAKGQIVLDSETRLYDIPSDAWDYRLGSRSALGWVLDQYKHAKARDETVRKRFDHYAFADHKESVIDLLARVANVSIQTMEIVKAMRKAHEAKS